MPLGQMGPIRLPRNQQPRPGNLRYGLFNVAPPVSIVNGEGPDANLADHAYGGGLLYDPVGCGTAHAYEIDCTPDAKTFDANSPEVEVLPLVVYATLVCGSFGYTRQYLTDKTSDRLFSSEQHAVEAAFWTGAPANTPYLTDPAGAFDVGAGGTYATVADAVAALEQYAYGTVPYGYNAVLHAQPILHAPAAGAYLVQAAATGYGPVWGAANTEPILRTSLGTKWVFGGGYPGTGPGGIVPAAGTSYMWITGNTTVWRQQEWSPPNLTETMTRQLNQYNVLAERGYLATYDCFHAYALVTTPEVGP